MKLNRKHRGIIYQLVVEAMERSHERPTEYNKDLVELEELLTKEYGKERNY